MSKSTIRHFAKIYCTPILWCLCVRAVRLIDAQQNVTSWLLQELNEKQKMKMQWGHVDEIKPPYSISHRINRANNNTESAQLFLTFGGAGVGTGDGSRCFTGAGGGGVGVRGWWQKKILLLIDCSDSKHSTIVLSFCCFHTKCNPDQINAENSQHKLYSTVWVVSWAMRNPSCSKTFRTLFSTGEGCFSGTSTGVSIRGRGGDSPSDDTIECSGLSSSASDASLRLSTDWASAGMSSASSRRTVIHADPLYVGTVISPLGLWNTALTLCPAFGAPAVRAPSSCSKLKSWSAREKENCPNDSLGEFSASFSFRYAWTRSWGKSSWNAAAKIKKHTYLHANLCTCIILILRCWVVKARLPPPLEAILVIFGCRALIFFLFESSWKNMKNDTTFVRMRSGDHLGDAKNVEKRHLAPLNLTFLLIAIDRNGFRRMKDEGQIYKTLPQNL